MASKAKWSLKHERVLVDLLHEYNVPRYRTNNGWSSEGWNKVVKAFNEKFSDLKFSKGQIQEHESQLKKDYKILKELRLKSGVSWDNQMGMMITTNDVWDEILLENTKVKKFRQRYFPLFDDLNRLYEGHIAEGRYHLTSIKPTKDIGSSTRSTRGKEKVDSEISSPEIEESMPHEIHDENLHQDYEEEQSHDEEQNMAMQNPNLQSKRSAKNSQSSGFPSLQRDKSKKNKNSIQNAMDTYIQFRMEQSRVRQATQRDEFSISKCVEVLHAMDDISDEQKVQASRVFKDSANRELFLSFQPNLRTMWLKMELEMLRT